MCMKGWYPVNSLNFDGRVASDPVMRYLQSGGAVANFTLMQSIGQRNTTMRCVLFASAQEMSGDRRINEETGEPVRTRFEYFMDVVRKGHDVSVSGRVQNNNYSTESGGKQTQTYGFECVVLDWTHHTSRQEAERLLAAQTEKAEQAALEQAALPI